MSWFGPTFAAMALKIFSTAGQALVFGFDITRDQRAVRSVLGSVPQETALYEELSAWDNMVFHADLYNVPSRGRNERIIDLLDLVQLTERRASRVSTFSGGMKRRLALARALLHGPQLLYLDEPTLGVDVQSRRALWDYILSTGAGAIVDSKVFPADKKIADDKIVGSGPYELTSYQTNQVAQFKPNPNYSGDVKLNNGGLVIQYYQDENALKLDVQQGKVDVVYPGLTPTAVNELKGKSGLNVLSGPGGAIRYMVFNLKTMPARLREVGDLFAAALTQGVRLPRYKR